MPHPEILYWAPTPDCATAAARVCDGWLSEFAPLCGFTDDYIERLWADGDGTEDDAVAAAKAVRSVHLAERILTSDTRPPVVAALADNPHLPLHVRFRACLCAKSLESRDRADSLLSSADPDDLVDLADRVNLAKWITPIAENYMLDVSHVDQIVRSIERHAREHDEQTLTYWMPTDLWTAIAGRDDLDLDGELGERCIRESPAAVLVRWRQDPALPIEVRRRCAERILDGGDEVYLAIVAETPGLDADHYRRALEQARKGTDRRVGVEEELSENPDVDLEFLAELPSTNGAAVARLLLAWADDRTEVWGLAAAAEPSDDITAGDYVETVIAATT